MVEAKQKKALKDIPLQEITLRKYEEPKKMKRDELAKKFLLSLGLLQIGESRDVIVDIFLLLLDARKEKRGYTIPQILKQLKNMPGASAPNIRRQLRRMKELKIVEKSDIGYRITEFGKLQPIVSDFIIQFIVNPSAERLKEYAEELDKYR